MMEKTFGLKNQMSVPKCRSFFQVALRNDERITWLMLGLSEKYCRSPLRQLGAKEDFGDTFTQTQHEPITSPFYAALLAAYSGNFFTCLRKSTFPIMPNNARPCPFSYLPKTALA
jgi:hypothetical protein